MIYAEALIIATTWVKKLQPFCDRIQIAGSIRREKSFVNDIEIVAVPKVVIQSDLFAGKVTMRHPGFAEVLQDQNELTVIKGNAHTGKYTQVHLDKHNIKMDVFTATAENFGLILGIRTGSADYSHKVLANGWVKAGYHSVDGMLCKNDVPVEVREEVDLFKLIGIPYVEPSKRNLKWENY